MRKQLKQALQGGPIKMISFYVFMSDHVSAGGCVLQKRHFAANLTRPDLGRSGLWRNLYSSGSCQQEKDTVSFLSLVDKNLALAKTDPLGLIRDEAPIIRC